MRDRTDITEAVNVYGDTVMRACAVHLRQQADRDDVFQETFLRYAQHEGAFNGEEHRKAWLIRVAVNACKDLHKRADRKNASLEADGSTENPALAGADTTAASAQALDLQEALQQIDEKYRTVLYLKYYEGYNAAEIGQMLGQPENTVYTNLARGRKALKEVLAHGD